MSERDYAEEYREAMAGRLFIVFVFALLMGAILIGITKCQKSSERSFNERPVYEISKVTELTGKNVVVITFTNGDSYEAEKYVLDYGLTPGRKIRFKDHGGLITRVKVIE